MSQIGELDLHLFGVGRHRRLWEWLGGQITGDGADFAVWAPNATSVEVLGDWSGWSHGVALAPQGESGVWAGHAPGATEGQRYKFRLGLPDGSTVMRSDPMSRWSEPAPGNASRLVGPRAQLAPAGAAEWRERRSARNGGRLSIYELHVGSWRRHPDGRSHSYRELAEPLAQHVSGLGFTHVELMPVASHPFGGSWGYQVTGYYAPDARGGDPDDLRALIATLHDAGIGVIVDWVPAHFPRDDGALARFDGAPLYEHTDPRRAEHPDWGTLEFDFGRPQVRNFLVANALYWLEEFGIDGLRVDAVASMLYLDYSRDEGEWAPNVHGGREDLEAVTFLRELNAAVAEEHPGALVIAEESTAWPGVTAPVEDGGLGFSRKWNLGWMHDTLGYFRREPVHRRFHHDELVFPMHYAFDERWILPLSHDEVVHGKGSLIEKLPGDRWQQFANLRALLAWQWAMPGDPLLFMGAELAQPREWSHDRELDWTLCGYGEHDGITALVAELNHVADAHPALWRGDGSSSAVWWLDADRADESTFAFGRYDPVAGDHVVCVANLTPIPRPGYRLGLPVAGAWRVVLSTDDERYGGSGHPIGVLTVDDELPWQGQPSSLALTLPPLSVLWFVEGSA